MVVTGACGYAGCMQMWCRAIFAPAYQKPVTAMLMFSSDVEKYKICKSGGGFALIT